jgi:flavorubredoxin
MPVKSLLIAYHSMSGASARLALAAAEGARSANSVEVCLARAWDVGICELEQVDGLVLAAAENAGHLSGGMKDMLDRVFYPACDRQLVLPYALLISAGNDGRNARAQVNRMLSGIPFKQVADPLIFRGEVTADQVLRASELGLSMALGLEMGIY